MQIQSVQSNLQLAPNHRFRSPLRYPGGKQKAIAQIACMFPEKACEYREPMVGGGSVFFHARNTKFAERYWINDQFRELIAFWQTTSNYELCEKLVHELEQLRSSFQSADEIEKYFQSSKNDPASADSFKEAFLFFFFNRVTFSGTTRAGGFSRAASTSRFTASSIERIRLLPDALRDVTITNRDFEEVITADGDDVFLFIDPPYFTAQKLYGRNGALHNFDHERLADRLKETNHRFLITYDDCPEIRSLFSWANIVPWNLQYGMNNCSKDNKSKIGNELFILNYEVNG